VLGAVVSRFTLIRLVRALPDPEIGQVNVLGVDDWAKRRGHGTGPSQSPEFPRSQESTRTLGVV
jgi:hypothetical protein